MSFHSPWRHASSIVPWPPPRLWATLKPARPGLHATPPPLGGALHVRGRVAAPRPLFAVFRGRGILGWPFPRSFQAFDAMTLPAPPPPPHARPTAPRPAATSDEAVDVRHVSKLYKPGLIRRALGRGGVHALAGVDLSVYRGEIFGLLGPNGAGKSTLVKILLGLVRPTSLEGDLLGAPVGRRSTMARVGYLPEQHRFPQYLRSEERRVG